MLIRDPRDLRRLLGKRLYASGEGRPLRLRRKEPAATQLELPACAKPPELCPLCKSKFRGRLLCWDCEAFACRLCHRWTQDGDGQHCAECKTLNTHQQALGTKAPLPRP